MKSVLGNLLLMVFGLCAGLLLLEVGVRIAGFSPPSSGADPTVGYRFRPNARYHHVGEEGSSDGRYNSAGWRDAEHALGARPGTTRILLLGDSFVSAFQVPLDSTFHRRLERGLIARALAGHHFEVVALGQDGNGTAAELLTYEQWGRAYRPDVVAVLFIPNDPADNVKSVALDPQRPFFVEDGDSLRLDLSFRDDPGFRRGSSRNWFVHHSALLAAARLAVARLRVKHQPPALPGGEVRDGYYRTWNFDRRVSADTIGAFRVTGKIYDRFAREVTADGRRFVVFASGFPQQEMRELLAEYRQRASFDANKSVRWLMEAGDRDGFKVVPLTPAFREASIALAKPLWFGHDSTYGHWNSLGHAVAARAMERYFARTLPGLDTTGTSPADVPGMAELERY